MPNLMLTTSCNLSCPYCFAVDVMDDVGMKQMSRETFIGVLDWIDRGDVPQYGIQLMGGEPMLYPDIVAIAEEVHTRARHITIYSNGTVPIVDRLVELSGSGAIDWVINANPPEMYNRKQQEIFDRNLSLLSQQASLCFNFHSLNMDFDHVFDCIEKFDNRRLVKLGITLPTTVKSNDYVGVGMFGEVEKQLEKFFVEARRHGVLIDTECGAPFCLFSNLVQEFTDLIRDDLISHCGSRLDITPDGKVINCLPLSRIAAIPYDQFPDYMAASTWFHKWLTTYGVLGLGEDMCLGCETLNAGLCKACAANCLGDFNRIQLPPLPDKPRI